MRELQVEQLRRVCDPDSFPFQTTDELPSPELGMIINQDRAREAIERALGVEAPGFNAYVVGRPGVGRRTLVERILERVTPTRSTPNDACLVYNFGDPWMPKVIFLPAGEGRKFAAQMAAFTQEIKPLITSVVEDFEDKVNAEIEQLVGEFREEAAQFGYVLQRDRQGRLGLAVDQELPLEERPEETPPPELQQRFLRLALKCEEIRQKAAREAEASNRDLIKQMVISRLEPLRASYGAVVEDFLGKVASDIAENYTAFLEREPDLLPRIFGRYKIFMEKESDTLQYRYEINVLVDHTETSGAPVVFESHPTYSNLVGSIEHIFRYGTWETDHTHVRPGAFHRANGGFLILEVLDLLRQAFAYDALKRALKTGELCIEPIGAEYSLFQTRSLKPEPIPLNVKVILLGEPLLFGLLAEADPEFKDLFKIRAEFEIEMERTPRTERDYADFIRIRQEQAGILPFDREATAEVAEYGSRLAGDQRKLSLRFGLINDLLQEASFVANQRGHPYVVVEDVHRALGARVYRLNYIEEKIRERIAEGTLLIDVDGEEIGQVNGLAINAVDEEYQFGVPQRITAQTFAGQEGVVDILREVKMGGPIHSKGVLILSGYLGGKYAQEAPLSLSASLTFEQTYGLVEGDSASAAELFALISSLSGVPLKQGIAVTGSVNQYGQIQPAGGITEKIEGFFDTCRIKGSADEQGVIIPTANVANLMLRKDVIEAVARGEFHIWAIGTVDEGLELLTDMPADEVHREATDKLDFYAKAMGPPGIIGRLRRLLR